MYLCSEWKQTWARLLGFFKRWACLAVWVRFIALFYIAIQIGGTSSQYTIFTKGCMYIHIVTCKLETLFRVFVEPPFKYLQVLNLNSNTYKNLLNFS